MSLVEYCRRCGSHPPADHDADCVVLSDANGSEHDYGYEGEHADEIETGADAFSALIDDLCEGT